jgi:hypothetical protein
MNTDAPSPDPTPDEPAGGAAGEKQNEPKKPRRHILGLPPGYKFDPDARPTADDVGGVPACFGDDEPRTS